MDFSPVIAIMIGDKSYTSIGVILSPPTSFDDGFYGATGKYEDDDHIWRRHFLYDYCQAQKTSQQAGKSSRVFMLVETPYCYDYFVSSIY